MRLAVRVVEHVAVGVEDRRLAKRVVGVFLAYIAELIQHRRDVAMLVLFVDRYLAAGVVTSQDLISTGPVNVPGYPVARPVPLKKRLPIVVGEEPGHASNRPPDA